MYSFDTRVTRDETEKNCACKTNERVIGEESGKTTCKVEEENAWTVTVTDKRTLESI